MNERRDRETISGLGYVECSGPIGRYVAFRLDGTGLRGLRGRFRRFASEVAAVEALRIDRYDRD